MEPADDFQKRLDELNRRYKRDMRLALGLIYISALCTLINVGFLLAQRGMLPL